MEENGKYWARTLEKVLAKAIEQFPAVVITGPRQSGKTTLLHHLQASQSYKFVTLDDPQLRLLAKNDPKQFLSRFSPPVVIDEIQYATELLPYIKIAIDNQRAQKGRFLLTGSQQFSLMKGVTESLAGRTAVLTLLPMSEKEKLFGAAEKNLLDKAENPIDLLAKKLLRGNYPELVVNPEMDSQLWYAGYLQTYLERDIRGLRQVGDLSEFQAFLQASAARNSQLLDLSSMSRDLGIAVNTVKAWIGILEASHQLCRVRPFFKNKGKRLVKSPKMYFTDTGFFSYLIGAREPHYAWQGPSAGALLETAVFVELMKCFTNKGRVPSIYFWRTSRGEEIDFIVELGTKLLPLEVKVTQTPSPAAAKNIDGFCELFADESLPGIVVCLTQSRVPLTRHCAAVPFFELADAVESLIK